MTVESATFLASLNTSLPDPNDGKSEGDDHLRLIKSTLQNTFPSAAGRFKRTQVKSANYTLVPGDAYSIIAFTAGSTLLGDGSSTATILGNGWHVGVYANGVDITVDPNGAELVNGAATAVIPNGSFGDLFCDGTGFLLLLSTKTFAQAQTIVVGTIGGNVTLTSTDLNSIKTVTAAADITLPAVSVAVNGQFIRFKNTVTALVRLLRAGSDTIDGGTAYTIPALSVAEVMRTAAGVWTLSIKPNHDVGNVIVHGANSAPAGWLLCDGSAVSRTTFGALFATISTAFGVGDGSTTFNLPNFARRTPVGVGGSGTGTLGNTVGSSGGEETHVLTSAESAAHTHSQSAHTHTIQLADSDAGSGNFALNAATVGTAGVETTSSVTPPTLGSSGSDGAHNNMQPSLVMAYLVKT